MIARPNGLALKGLLLTGAISLAFGGGACLAQAPAAPQSVSAGQYDGVETPKSMRVYAPVMSQSERDAFVIRIIIIGAAGLGAVIALIVWRSMPPKAKPTTGGSQTVAATPTSGAAEPQTSAPAAAPTEGQAASAAEKPAVADSVAEANKAEVAQANKTKTETTDGQAAAAGPAAEKPAIADSVAEANKTEVAEANKAKGETSEVQAPAENKSES
jgi:hypothetical protein